MRSRVLNLQSKRLHDFDDVATGSTGTEILLEDLDVACFGDAVLAVRVHSNATTGTSKMTVSAYSTAPSSDEPNTAFVATTAAASVTISASTTPGTLLLAGATEGFGGALQLRISGTREGSDTLRAELSIELVARVGVAAPRRSLADTLVVGSRSSGTDIIVSSTDVIRGEDGGTPTGVAVRGGNATSSATGGAATVTGGSGGATGTAGNAVITGGAGGATSGNAGSVTIQGGVPVSGAGGGVTLSGRNGVGTSQAGGAVTGTAGNSTGSGAAGGVTLTGGTGGTTGAAGVVSITGGAGGSSSGAGGAATLRGGAGGASGTAGGVATLLGGTGNGAGAGGAAAVTGGTPGSAGTGGAVTVTGGVGGTSSGAGGSATLQAGTTTDGVGAAVSVLASAGMGMNRAGGAVSVTGGASTGSGTAGAVTITGGASGGSGSGGDVTLAPGSSSSGTPGAVDVGGAFLTSSVLSPSALSSGDNNNYAPTGHAAAAVLRLTPNASGSTLTGLAGGRAGRRVTVVNVSTTVAITIGHQDTASSNPVNRFICPGSVDLVMPGNSVRDVWYDGTTSRWRVIGAVA